MIASSSGWTPLFLNAEPHSSGVIERSSVAARIAAFSASSETGWSSRNASMISSSWSATASISLCRYSAASSPSSPVGVSSSHFIPREST